MGSVVNMSMTSVVNRTVVYEARAVFGSVAARVAA